MEIASTNQEIKLEVGVKAFITNSDGKYLVLKKAKPYHGLTECMWDIPGGRINPGEPLAEALAREIKEETQMEMTGTPEVIFAQDILRVEGRHVVRLTYLTDAKGDIILDGKEHTESKWVDISELVSLYHDKYLDPVIPLLKNGKPG